jgi:LPXTG-motif cell wall-anchored protein
MRRIGLAAVVLLVGIGAWVVAHRGPSGPQLDPAGPIEFPGDPAVVAHHPADPRINGLDFAATINGSGLFGAIGAGADRRVAGQGRSIAYVSVSRRSVPGRLGFDRSNASSPDKDLTGAMVVNGRRYPLDMSLLANFGNDAFAQSVPAGASVLFELTKGGLTEAFSLNANRLVGPVPSVLYRSTDGYEPTASDTPAQTIDARLPDGTPSPLQLSIRTPSLSWFGFDSVSHHPRADEAWLVLDPNLQSARAADASNPLGVFDGHIAPELLRLVLPNGTTETSTYLSNGDPLQTSSPVGRYVFPVPADLTSGRVVVDPGRVTAVPNGITPEQPSKEITAPATIPLAFPTPLRPPPTVSASAARPATGRALWPWLVVLAGLALVGLAALVLRRRRRGRVLVRFEESGLSWLASPGSAPAALGSPPRALGPAPERIEQPEEPIQAPGAPEPVPLSVRLLGPAEIDGLSGRITSLPVLRLLIYLAVNSDRFVGTEELRVALASAEADLSAQSVHAYASRLRRFLPAGALPGNKKDGYRLTQCGVDWARFIELAELAGAAGDERRLVLLREALSLVRGEPLAHAGFAALDNTVSVMTGLLARTAHAAAELLLADEDPAGAEWAAGQGLLASPGAPQLWEDRLAAAAAGSGTGLERTWAEARRVLGADASTLEASYRRLHAEAP